MRTTTSKPLARQSRLKEFIDGARGGVFTSSELIGVLGKTGTSEESARQMIRRRMDTDGLWRSEKLRLANNERLFAAASTIKTPEFLTAVSKKLAKTKRKGMARCIATLAERHVLHKVEVLRLLAVSPLEKSETTLKRLYQGELEGLKELGVRLIQENTPLESLVSPTIPDAEGADGIATLATEGLRNGAVLTRILADRFRRQNILAWNQIDMPDLKRPYTLFNGHVFSAFGFSYLAPLTRWNDAKSKPIPCPTLFDCYHGVCKMAEVESFIQRIQRATIRGKTRLPALGVLAARDFARDAWDFARAQGLITISFRQIFGNEALEAMVLAEKMLHGLNSEVGDASVERFKTFTQLVGELKSNPIVAALRSIAFEALSGLILRTKGYEQVELGRVVPWNKTSRDVDVFGFRGDELRIIECKAYHRRKSLLPEDVRKFFTETVPALKHWLRSHGRNFAACKAELWTTGPLGNRARDELHALKSPTNDVWAMFRVEDLKSEIPTPIRNRSIELFRNIALAEMDDIDDAE